MAKLKELWEELRSLDPTDPARKEVQKKINEIEQFCISKGYEGFKITQWHDISSVSKNYPENSGAIWFGDYEKLEEVIRRDKI